MVAVNLLSAEHAAFSYTNRSSVLSGADGVLQTSPVIWISIFESSFLNDSARIDALACRPSRSRVALGRLNKLRLSNPAEMREIFVELQSPDWIAI